MRLSNKKVDSGFTEINFNLVEMMGIEPMSESIFTGISPSAAYDLLFRLITRPQAGWRIRYPVSPSSYRELT